MDPGGSFRAGDGWRSCVRRLKAAATRLAASYIMPRRSMPASKLHTRGDRRAAAALVRHRAPLPQQGHSTPRRASLKMSGARSAPAEWRRHRRRRDSLPQQRSSTPRRASLTSCMRRATAARWRHRRHRASLPQQRHSTPLHASPKMSCTRAATTVRRRPRRHRASLPQQRRFTPA